MELAGKYLLNEKKAFDALMKLGLYVSRAYLSDNWIDHSDKKYMYITSQGISFCEGNAVALIRKKKIMFTGKTFIPASKADHIDEYVAAGNRLIAQGKLKKKEPKSELDEMKENLRPPHYKEGEDTFSWMEKRFSVEELQAFAEGNIHKYLQRSKGQDIKDFGKIADYALWIKGILEKDEEE